MVVPLTNKNSIQCWLEEALKAQVGDSRKQTMHESQVFLKLVTPVALWGAPCGQRKKRPSPGFR